MFLVPPNFSSVGTTTNHALIHAGFGCELTTSNNQKTISQENHREETTHRMREDR